jgi:hypothetical protein
MRSSKDAAVHTTLNRKDQRAKSKKPNWGSHPDDTATYLPTFTRLQTRSTHRISRSFGYMKKTAQGFIYRKLPMHKNVTYRGRTAA